MKKVILFIFYFHFVNCDSRPYVVPEKTPLHYLEFTPSVPKYFRFNTYDTLSETSTASKLLDKTLRLSNLSHKYRILKIGSVKKATSYIFRAVEAKPEIYFSEKNHYKIDDLRSFKQSIHSAYYAKLEGQAINYSDIKIKVEIEELIFDSSENASTLLSYINHVRNIEYYWKSLDKTPSYMFREKNRIYFIRMRHKNLINYPSAIAKTIKD